MYSSTAPDMGTQVLLLLAPLIMCLTHPCVLGNSGQIHANQAETVLRRDGSLLCWQDCQSREPCRGSLPEVEQDGDGKSYSLA